MSEIVALERKAAMLIRQQQDAQAEIQQLKEDNIRLASELSRRDEQIVHFQNTIKINKIANQTVADKNETTELKRTINEYIKKIDRCIAQLSQ
jgi:hypothetical protein